MYLVLSLDQEKEILKINNRCCRCLKSNHSSKYCKSKISGDNSKGRHVSVICNPNYSVNGTVKGIEGHSQAVNNLLTKSDGMQIVLLQTAKAVIFKEPDMGRKWLLYRWWESTRLHNRKCSKGTELLGCQKLTVIPFGCNIKICPIVYNKVYIIQ